jgi:hypothetical protein
LTGELENRASAMRSRVQSRILDANIQLETAEGSDITHDFL